MTEQNIDHLLTILSTKRPLLNAAIINNLVYYTPRIKSLPELTRLINAVFERARSAQNDIFELFEMSQAIVQWKLEISEPFIQPSEFFSIWDSCFTRCRSWTRPQLAILAGILSTRDEFTSIQAENFIDDTGMISRCYHSWMHKLFIPTWSHFMKISKREAESLVLIFAVIFRSPDDTDQSIIPWDAVTTSLSNSFTFYLADAAYMSGFFAKNLSKVARTLQISLERNSGPVLSDFLSQTCRNSYNLSVKELESQNPNKSYSDKFYSGILFTIVLSLNGIMQRTQKIPQNWYSQIIMCLFYLSFITEDVGVIGFESYESLYQVACTGITLTNETKAYYNVLGAMKANIWTNLPHQNKVNKAKLLFLLNFMGETLSRASRISLQFVKSFIEPLQQTYANSSSEQVRESIHVMILALFNSTSLDSDIAEWQVQNYRLYVTLATDQFMSNKISGKQLIMIYQKMSSRLPSLQLVNKHLSRETLHCTYLRVLNCPSNDTAKQVVLLKCIIYQLPYLNEDYLLDWLDTCNELLSSIKFNRKQRDEIISTFWAVISHSKSDTALKWWYAHLGCLQARL